MGTGVVKRQQVNPKKVTKARQLRQRMTSAESALWARVRANQLAGLHFRRQQVIDGFIVDFFCDSARVVVELDGPIHDATAEEDADRDRIIRARGLRIIRFPNERVLQSLENVLLELLQFCRAP